MDTCFVNKEMLKEYLNKIMSTHTDWTGTRVETKEKCDSVDKFADKLWNFIENNHGNA